MLNNVRTLAFCITHSLLPRTVTTLTNRVHLTFTLRNTIQLITCRHVSSSPTKSVNTSDIDDFEGESPYLNIDFDAIAGTDPEKIRQLRKIQLELDMMRQQGEKVPSALTIDQWTELLCLTSLNARVQCYNFLWMNEYKKRKKKEKQSQQHEEYLAKRAEEPPSLIEITTGGPIIYSLAYNTLFWRISDTAMRQIYNLKLLNASMFNPHIIVDCGFEAFMCPRNISLCAKQILLMWSENRNHRNPFHLLFCNLSKSSQVFIKLRKTICNVDEPDSPFHFTPQHYLDLYPKEKLVYLTPHCTEYLNEYSHDDIYIIGGYVDKNRCEPLTLAKAKKEGLRMAKFPIDKYLKWQMGVKSLTLNQCLAIMNDLKETNDWNTAFKHIPSRKTKPRLGESIDEALEKFANHMSAKIIREHYRRNLVYDLLMKEKLEEKQGNEPSGKN